MGERPKSLFKFNLRAFLPPRPPHPKSSELPLTGDVNEIFLNNHFILEILVLPKRQCDLAAKSGMLEILHLPGQRVGVAWGWGGCETSL